MIEAIVLGVTLAVLQFMLHRNLKSEVARRLNHINNGVNLGANAAVHARDGIGNVHDMLAPAVAQLPKTRAKKGKPSSEPETQS